jgi:hypothetical protein
MPVNAPIEVVVHAPPAMQAARFTEEGTRESLVASSRPSLGKQSRSGRADKNDVTKQAGQ